MRLKMIHDVSGLHDGEQYPARGKVGEFEAEIAADLLRLGHAVKAELADLVETADARTAPDPGVNAVETAAVTTAGTIAEPSALPNQNVPSATPASLAASKPVSK